MFTDLHPFRSDGTSVDATFTLEAVPVFELVYQHKAGARNSPRAVNTDYHEGLELLLERLAALDATILGITVDSGVAQQLPPADREVDLPFPIDLTDATDFHKLRLQITRAQRPIARRPDAQPGGGNDQKTIRITFSCEDSSLDLVRVQDVLVHGPVRPRPAPSSPSAKQGTVTKHELQGWVTDALTALGGSGTIVEVAEEIWRQHEDVLRGAGDLFYTWQYDIRWAAQALRDAGLAKPAAETPRGIWALV